MHPTFAQAPGVVLTYNLFMNEVGRFDQLYASHTTGRGEHRVIMSMFTFFVDANMQKSYAWYRAVLKCGTNMFTNKSLGVRYVKGKLCCSCLTGNGALNYVVYLGKDI